MKNLRKHHVVIVGGGFGGLYTAKALKDAPVKITIIDKRNFHLFQPLLYQVATGALSPGDIASPLRAIFSDDKNVSVLKAEVTDIKPKQRKVILGDDELRYDSLIIATGVTHHYFGNETWAKDAPGLKSIEDALEMRRRILLAFEAAEREPDPVRRRAWMNFVIVGGGPTGVELAGALAELAHATLKNEFRRINPADVNVMLLEGTDRVLSAYPPELTAKAEKSLARLGVVVKTNTLVTNINNGLISTEHQNQTEKTRAKTVLWAAGMKASPLGEMLSKQTGVELDKAGRVVVEPSLTIAGHPNIFVIGDLTHFANEDGEPLPGIAPVAMQEGQHVAKLIKRRLQGKELLPFRYVDKGSMAVIGRNAAVAQVGRLKLNGFPAWFLWVFIHIWYLIGFDNKFNVMSRWAWNYFTYKRGVRLITGRDETPARATLNKLRSI